ncbi:MAG: hypothetical protein CVV47_14590 [Spirochaetae bacterium HGW-Spirochaetae-3]|nr:MAG: hypothetical protein CVV47_14590 [Spirochaetae bacterium HGW-Spirochaetae-3]
MVSPRNVSPARSAMLRLEAEGYESIGLKFNDRWRIETHSRFDTILGGASHALCILDRQDSESAWFAYIVGLARGRSMPLALYLLDPGIEPLGWIDDLRVFPDLNAVAEYYLGEGEEWEVKEKRRQAKSALLELGISWHAESFAQCVRDGDTKAAELFIESGFPPDIREKTGVPMLCLAARHKHLSIVELLLEHGADIDVQSDDRGYSPLMDAAQQGDGRLLRYLLDKGANTDLQSKDGQTAIVLAVGRSDADIVEALLSGGADPDIADKLGLTARKYAKLFHDPRIDAALSAGA